MLDGPTGILAFILDIFVLNVFRYSNAKIYMAVGSSSCLFWHWYRCLWVQNNFILPLLFIFFLCLVKWVLVYHLTNTLYNQIIMLSSITLLGLNLIISLLCFHPLKITASPMVNLVRKHSLTQLTTLLILVCSLFNLVFVDYLLRLFSLSLCGLFVIFFMFLNLDLMLWSLVFS